MNQTKDKKEKKRKNEEIHENDWIIIILVLILWSFLQCLVWMYGRRAIPEMKQLSLTMDFESVKNFLESVDSIVADHTIFIYLFIISNFI